MSQAGVLVHAVSASSGPLPSPSSTTFASPSTPPPTAPPLRPLPSLPSLASSGSPTPSLTGTFGVPRSPVASTFSSGSGTGALGEANNPGESGTKGKGKNKKEKVKKEKVKQPRFVTSSGRGGIGNIRKRQTSSTSSLLSSLVQLDSASTRTRASIHTKRSTGHSQTDWTSVISLSLAMDHLDRAERNDQLDALLLANSRGIGKSAVSVPQTLVSQSNSAPNPSISVSSSSDLTSSAQASSSGAPSLLSSAAFSNSRLSLSPSQFSSSTGSSSHLTGSSARSQLSRLSLSRKSAGSSPTSPTALNYLIPYAVGEDALGVTVGRECVTPNKGSTARTGRGGAGNMKKLIQNNKVCVDFSLYPNTAALMEEHENRLKAQERSIIEQAQQRARLQIVTGRGGSGNINSKKLEAMRARANKSGKKKAKATEDGDEEGDGRKKSKRSSFLSSKTSTTDSNSDTERKAKRSSSPAPLASPTRHSTVHVPSSGRGGAGRKGAQAQVQQTQLAQLVQSSQQTHGRQRSQSVPRSIVSNLTVTPGNQVPPTTPTRKKGGPGLKSFWRRVTGNTSKGAAKEAVPLETFEGSRLDRWDTRTQSVIDIRNTYDEVYVHSHEDDDETTYSHSLASTQFEPRVRTQSLGLGRVHALGTMGGGSTPNLSASAEPLPILGAAGGAKKLRKSRHRDRGRRGTLDEDETDIDGTRLLNLVASVASSSTSASLSTMSTSDISESSDLESTGARARGREERARLRERRETLNCVEARVVDAESVYGSVHFDEHGRMFAARGRSESVLGLGDFASEYEFPHVEEGQAYSPTEELGAGFDEGLGRPDLQEFGVYANVGEEVDDDEGVVDPYVLSYRQPVRS